MMASIIKVTAYYVPAEESDAYRIAANARKEDIVELWAASRTDPLHAMIKGIRNSPNRCFTGWADGEPICMFGVAEGSLLGNTGIPWMIGSSKLDDHAMTFLRNSHRALSFMSLGYDTLFNYVDARNTKAIEWLRWLGFDIEEARPYGPDGVDFHRFTKRLTYV